MSSMPSCDDAQLISIFWICLAALFFLRFCVVRRHSVEHSFHNFMAFSVQEEKRTNLRNCQSFLKNRCASSLSLSHSALAYERMCNSTLTDLLSAFGRVIAVGMANTYTSSRSFDVNINYEILWKNDCNRFACAGKQCVVIISNRLNCSSHETCRFEHRCGHWGNMEICRLTTANITSKHTQLQFPPNWMLHEFGKFGSSLNVSQTHARSSRLCWVDVCKLAYRIDVRRKIRPFNKLFESRLMHQDIHDSAHTLQAFIHAHCTHPNTRHAIHLRHIFEVTSVCVSLFLQLSDFVSNVFKLI